MKVTGADDPLPIAVRAWTTPHRAGGQGRSPVVPIKHWLVFDTETTTDATQALTFGTARYLRADPDSGDLVPVAEIIFHADDLPERDPTGHAILATFAADNRADVNMQTLLGEPEPRLLFMSRHEFVRSWLTTHVSARQTLGHRRGNTVQRTL